MVESANSPYKTPEFQTEKTRNRGPVVLALIGVIGIAAAIAIGNYRYRQALRAEAVAVQARHAAQARQQQLEEEAATQSGQAELTQQPD